MSIKNMVGLDASISATLDAVISVKDTALAQFANPLAEASTMKAAVEGEVAGLVGKLGDMIPALPELPNLSAQGAIGDLANIDVTSKKIFEKNSYYILNIWVSWCVHCRKEHPFLMELSKNQSVKLIGLNYRDNFNNAEKFINELGNPYDQILIDSDGTLGIEFGAYGVPETFLIDKNQKIIKRFIGPINEKMVEQIKLIIK